MTAEPVILCVNSGSSSLKFALYQFGESAETALAEGAVERIGWQGGRLWIRAAATGAMEGVTGEAASLAGHLKLSNLCLIYDNNRITIEGHTALTFSEDVATRFLNAAIAWRSKRWASTSTIQNTVSPPRRSNCL